MRTATCINGLVSVAVGISDGEEVHSADYEVEAYDVIIEPEFHAADIEAAAWASKATCIGRVRSYDNLPDTGPLPIRMTETQVRLSWLWDGTRIRGVGRCYLKSYRLRATGWIREEPRAVFRHQKTLNSSGYWVKQGAEGWSTYFNQVFNNYRHTHEMAIFVDRLGRCWGEDRSWGVLPGRGNNNMRMDVYRGPYEPPLS
ncbi:MAG: hypothetical protein KJZ78_21695 [Bryobacteraceae bacterium]|nr:hypothetical protein [Bryobacteraceae bacterium]